MEPVNFELISDAVPVFEKVRHLPYGTREGVKNALDELERSGIIQSIESSTWATPLVVVSKGNGKFRICGDYKVTVNKFIKQSASVTPPPEDIFEKTTGAKYFSKIDLKDVFLQLPITKEAQEITTLHTMWGLYSYKFLPFGLKNSPGLFQRAIDKIIEGVQGCYAYQDDILVLGSTEKEHDVNLTRLLQSLMKHNVKINVDKCIAKVKALPFLGYIISENGIIPDETKYKPIVEAPDPKSQEELRSLLGYLQYYSRFIKDFADKTRSLQLIVNNSEFEWNPELSTSLKNIVSEIVKAKPLKPFKQHTKIELIVDASEFAIGGVLEQDGCRLILSREN